MRTTILFIFSALISISIRAQEIKSYDLNVNIDVASRRIHVKGSMDVDFKTCDSISLVLWKSSSIHSIRSNQTQLTYNFDTIAPSPIMYIEQGRNLTVVKPVGSKQKQRVFVDYDCDMHNLVGWAKSFSDDWIELNFYCAWFPINGRNFTSNINVTIADQYNVTGSGIVTKKKKYWKMKQAWSGFDNVIMASRKLKTKVLDDKDIRIELDYADLSESAADSALAECKFTFNLFESLYGAKDKTNLKLVITPFAEGGGYSRKNFISWRTKKFNFDTRCGLSHEIGHFWWSGANATDWEDWLNESFADYCKLIFIRERISLRVYNLNIDFNKKGSQNTPPIWGLDRNDPNAFHVFYQKGALILTELEQKVGKDQFYGFLRLVLKNNVRTTNDFLALIEVKFSRELRDWLENKLKTA